MPKKTLSPAQISFHQIKEALMNLGYDVVLTDHCLEVDGSRRRRQLNKTIKGYIAPDEDVIYINRKLGLNDRVVTLIHELMHELKPRWSEHSVENEAKKLFHRLNIEQLGFLQFFVITPKDPQNFLLAPAH